jgi:hypothetical protein
LHSSIDSLAPSKILSLIPGICKFYRIRIADTTGFKLSIKYIEKYPGTASEKSPVSAIKIQLEYDLLTGKYLNYLVYGGRTNDTLYLGTLQEGIRESDLCLRDLGYYKLSDLKEIDEKNTYFISWLKINLQSNRATFFNMIKNSLVLEINASHKTVWQPGYFQLTKLWVYTCTFTGFYY